MLVNCAICNNILDGVKEYVLHLRCHFKLQVAEPLLCIMCINKKKVFVDAKKLSKHLRRTHFDKRHVCPDCGKAFISLHKLKVHVLCHSQFAEFLCSLCGRNYKRKDKLRDHLMKKHSQDRAEKSRSTQIRKQRLKRLRFSKLTQEEVSKFPYCCASCSIGFNRRGILVNHLSKFHPEVSLSSEPQLTTPVLQPQRSFKCLHCDRVYMSNGKRKSHTLSCHPGAEISSKSDNIQDLGCIEVKPHSCSQCPRQFLTNAKLLQHKRKFHSNSKTTSQNSNKVTVLSPNKF